MDKEKDRREGGGAKTDPGEERGRLGATERSQGSLPARTPAETEWLVLTGGTGVPVPTCSPTPAAMLVGSTNLWQTETRDFGFILIDIFIYPRHHFFEVSWFYSDHVPRGLAGDTSLLRGPPVHPDSALHTPVGLSHWKRYVCLPLALVLNPLCLSCIFHPG